MLKDESRKVFFHRSNGFETSRFSSPHRRISHTSSFNFFLLSSSRGNFSTRAIIERRRESGRKLCSRTTSFERYPNKKEEESLPPPLPFKQAKATISHSSSYLLCHRENLRDPCRPTDRFTLLSPLHRSSPLLIPLSRSSLPD